jgi:hypothetical protein
MSSDDDDLVMLAAVARSIVENPPTSDEDPEEEPGGHEEGVAHVGGAQFLFDGKELRLPRVSDADSKSYRIEALRQFIEEGLGIDRFINVYQFIRVDSDQLSPVEMDVHLRKMLSTPKQLTYYPLIEQLIVCEESEISE